jgi:hypothetical protein
MPDIPILSTGPFSVDGIFCPYESQQTSCDMDQHLIAICASISCTLRAINNQSAKV